MLRYFVILKCEVKKKRHCMLRYFVILKCEVGKKAPHASLLCDTEVCSGKKRTLHAALLSDPLYATWVVTRASRARRAPAYVVYEQLPCTSMR